MASAPLPYCGPPPSPADWLVRWNLDPWVIGALLAAAVAFEVATRHGRPHSAAVSFRAGLLLLGCAFVSPLCTLAVALFSARVAQHLVVLLVAAPLLVHGARALASRRGPRCGVGAGHGDRGLAAAATFAGAFVFWHVPAAYEATFASPFAFWTMHGSMFAPALAFWASVLPHGRSDRASAPTALPAIAVVAIPMGLLGAVLTLAPRGLYAPHAATTSAFGLSSLQDQQLGGLVMWVPGSATLLAASIVVALQLARGPGAATAPPSA